MRRHELANALVVVDLTDDRGADAIAPTIHEFVQNHEDEYKVIVGTKPSSAVPFHPRLSAYPDVHPSSHDNVDFDAVFTSDGGFQSEFARAALANARGEGLYDYLEAHGIGRVDVIGFRVAPLAFESVTMGYATTVFAPLTAGESICTLADFMQHGVAVEGWTE